jgi:hypothetical protein
MITAEGRLHEQVCDYLRLRYKSVIFRTDFAAGIKMTMGQAVRHKRLQSERAYPDLFIAEPRNGFAGLFLELKATNIYKKNGNLKSDPHLQAQEQMLIRLRNKGYFTGFAIGFDHAKRLIDVYMR